MNSIRSIKSIESAPSLSLEYCYCSISASSSIIFHSDTNLSSVLVISSTIVS